MIVGDIKQIRCTAGVTKHYLSHALILISNLVLFSKIEYEIYHKNCIQM